VFLESRRKICRILNRSTLGAVMLVLQEKKQSQPNEASEDGSEQQGPMPDEPRPNLFRVRHLMDAAKPQGNHRQPFQITSEKPFIFRYLTLQLSPWSGTKTKLLGSLMIYFALHRLRRGQALSNIQFARTKLILPVAVMLHS
jgi:hypothetical protein